MTDVIPSGTETMVETIAENTNVVYLKDFKKPTEPNNPDVVPANWESGYDDYMDNVTLSVTFDVAELLSEYGFDIEGVPNVGYDLMMVIESIKSLAYRTQSEFYPLQDISEDLFDIDDPDQLVNDFLNGE